MCCFINFQKAFDIMLRIHLWKTIKELKAPLKLRHATTRLYENVITKFKGTLRVGWKKSSVIYRS